MSELALTIRDVGKRYQIAHEREPYGRLSETITEAVRGAVRMRRRSPAQTKESFWAVRNVNLDVRTGEVVGIIGRNGAGKSTLLKILSRITEPTTGRIELRGQVASLLEVGTGFHQELTGRENVYLSGAILGMNRAEIGRRFDEIVSFAGVERFLDTPVKRYSSGMLVRLGFAVAAYLEPDILIVDEVLAVGDAAFQQKSIAKMEDVSRSGRTVLFVTHNMPSVESLCTRAVLLDEGSVAADGAPGDVVGAYLHATSTRTAQPLLERSDRRGNGSVRIAAIEAAIKTGADSHVRLAYEAADELHNVEVALNVFGERAEGVANLSTRLGGETFGLLPRAGAVICRIPRATLLPGRYTVNAKVIVNGEVADWIQEAAEIEVAPGDYFGTGKLPPKAQGSVVIDQSWVTETG